MRLQTVLSGDVSKASQLAAHKPGLRHQSLLRRVILRAASLDEMGQRSLISLELIRFCSMS